MGEKDVPLGNNAGKLKGHWYTREYISPWAPCSIPEIWAPPPIRRPAEVQVPSGKFCGKLWNDHHKLRLQPPGKGVRASPGTPTTEADQKSLEEAFKEVAGLGKEHIDT